MTDETNIYSGIRVKGQQQIAGMERQTVNHGSGEYVRGDVHTNTAEGFISPVEARHRRHVPSRRQGPSRASTFRRV